MFANLIQNKLIEKSVGNNMTSKPKDVLSVKDGLNSIGAFETKNDLEPNGFITRDFDTSVKKFQKERGLKIDGILKPGGETETALVNELRKNASSREEIERKNEDWRQTKCQVFRETRDKILRHMEQNRKTRMNLEGEIENIKQSLKVIENALREIISNPDMDARILIKNKVLGPVGAVFDGIESGQKMINMSSLAREKQQLEARLKNAILENEKALENAGRFQESLSLVYEQMNRSGCI